MGTISVSLPSDGETADASDYNTPITTITNEINGNLDNANVKAGAAIDGSKFAAKSIPSTKLADGIPVQVVSTNFASAATGTTTVPVDDSIPQNTEGTEFMTLAITPKSTTNILVIEVVAYLSCATVSRRVVGALFQDATAGALAASETYTSTGAAAYMHTIKYMMVAGTTSETTFKFRAGPESAATVTFNGLSGSRTYGNITKSNMTIMEYNAS